MTRLLADQLRARATTGRGRREGPARDIRSSYDARVLLTPRGCRCRRRSSSRTSTRAPELARLAHAGHWTTARRALLRRNRVARASRSRTSPLLDEAGELLGPFDPTGGAAKRAAQATATATSRTPAQAIENHGRRGHRLRRAGRGSFAEGGDPARRPSAPPRTASGPTGHRRRRGPGALTDAVAGPRPPEPAAVVHDRR